MLMMVASVPQPTAWSWILGGAALMVMGLVMIYGQRRNRR